MLARLGQQNAAFQGPALWVFVLVSGGMISCIYIVIPIAFVLFYQSRHVKATCERKDPKPRWTDRCPLPVLGLCVMLALGLVSFLVTPMYNFVLPFFGSFLSGWQGALLWLVNLAVLVYLVRGLYKLRPAAWWVTVAWVLFLTASSIVTFTARDPIEMYEAMGLPEEQLQAMREMNVTAELPMPLLMAAGAVAFLAYLVFVRKYFAGNRLEAESL
jgi:hypothetical protein